MQSVASKTATASKFRWEDHVKDPLVQKLKGLILGYERQRHDQQGQIGAMISHLLKKFTEDQIKTIIVKVLRKKQQTAKIYVNWGVAYVNVPNDRLWRAVGFDGVFLIAAVVEKKNRQAVIKRVLDQSDILARDPVIQSPVVGRCYVETTLIKLGEPVAAKALACTKAQYPTRPLPAKVKAALVDLREMLARYPSFEGEFSPKTIDLLKNIDQIKMH